MDTSWLESTNNAIKNVGDIYGTFKATKAKVQQKINGARPNATIPPNPAPQSITDFGGGQYGGFSGTQIGMVALAVLALGALAYAMRGR